MNSLSRFFYFARKLIPPFIVFSFSKKSTKSQSYQKSLVDIRKTFQSLGVTFIKLGQLLSARPDIVGPDLAIELRKLLDQEPAMSFETVQRIIEKELNKPLKEVFKEFDENPLSTASIGQVHKAKLKNGTKVAVKIQRAGIKEIIDKDLEVFHGVSKLADMLIGKKGFKFSYIDKEFSQWINNELDFSVEAKRADKFKENMVNIQGVFVPKVYWDYTTSYLLVTQFLEGLTVNQILTEMESQKVSNIYDVKLPYKVNPDLIIEHMVNAFVKQILIDKFFHGDLHPANLIIGKGNTLGFVDFGIVGTLDNREHTQIIMMLLAFVDDDPQTLTKILLQFCTTPLPQNKISFLYDELADELRLLHETAAGKASISHLIMLLMGLAVKYDFTMSPGLLLGAKTIAQIDSISQELGVKQPIVDIIKPSIEHYMSASFTVDFSREMLFKSVLSLIDSGKRLPETITDLEKLVTGGQIIENSMISPTPALQESSAIKHAFSVGIALAATIPVAAQPFVINSPYKVILILAIPLLLYGILVRILKA